MSLRLKISIVFILCILLTFTPLLYIMQTRVKEENLDKLDREISQLLDSKSNEVGFWLERKMVELKVILGMDIVNNMDEKELNNYIERLNKSKDFNNRFAIGGKDGRGFISKDWYIDISNRDYFKKLMNEDVDYVISEPVISRSDNTPIFLMSYALRNTHGEKIGFVNGAIALDNISKIAEGIKIYDGFSWIMNASRKVYSTDEAYIKSNYLDDGGLSRIAESYQFKKDGILAMEDVNGNRCKVFYSHIPNSENWILCTMIKFEAMNEQIDNIVRIIVGIGIIFIVVSIITSIFIASSTVKPINSLKGNMEDVSKGNLNSYYRGKGKDEISSLGRYFNTMLDDIKSLLEKTSNMERQKRDLEIKVLQSQIKPHFLYNTLDTIQWKALSKGNFEVADLINNLSDFFRLSLNEGREFVSIEDELRQADLYLNIQKIRYEDKLDYEFEIDPKLREVIIPKLILQPLIENSIYHGIKLIQGLGHIKVIIGLEEENLKIIVEDNGRGMSFDLLSKIRSNLGNSVAVDNYGLYSVNERLKSYYGDLYSIEIESKEYIGTIVSIKIEMEAFDVEDVDS